MASAIKMTKKVAIPMPPVITQYRDEDDGVSLRLTQREAVVLNALVRRIGGEPYTSVHAQTAAIEAALTSAGVKSLTYAESRSLINNDNHAENGSIALLDKLMQQSNDPYAGVIGLQNIGQVQQVGYDAPLKRAVEGYQAQQKAGAAIQGCLDKIPETIVNAKYKY